MMMRASGSLRGCRRLSVAWCALAVFLFVLGDGSTALAGVGCVPVSEAGVRASVGGASSARGLGGLPNAEQSRNAALVGELTFDLCRAGCMLLDISVSDGYAYVADKDNGVRIVDVTDPTVPVEVARYDPPEMVWDVFAVGGYAYVIVNDRGLVILDVSDPPSPTEVGEYYVSSGVRVYVHAQYVFVVDWMTVVWILDVSDHANPKLVGNAIAPNPGITPGWMFVSGSYLYTSSLHPGLYIWDISDLAYPDLWGVYEEKVASHPFVVGDYAYVGGGLDGFYILDVSDPVNPVEVSSMFEDVGAGCVYVSGEYAYLTVGDGSVKVLIVSDPSNPVVGGYYYLPKVVQLVVDEGLVYVIDYRDKLYILSFTPTAIELSAPRAELRDGSVVVVWESAVSDFEGFDVLRALVGDRVGAGAVGEYERVNVVPVRGVGTLSFSDGSVVPGCRYSYKVLGRRRDGGVVESGSVLVSVPLWRDSFLSLGVRPNPSASVVEIDYGVGSPGEVDLGVFSVGGKLVRSLLRGFPGGGVGSVLWDGRDASGREVSSGVYFILLESPGGKVSRKVSLFR